MALVATAARLRRMHAIPFRRRSRHRRHRHPLAHNHHYRSRTTACRRCACPSGACASAVRSRGRASAAARGMCDRARFAYAYGCRASGSVSVSGGDRSSDGSSNGGGQAQADTAEAARSVWWRAVAMALVATAAMVPRQAASAVVRGFGSRFDSEEPSGSARLVRPIPVAHLSPSLCTLRAERHLIVVVCRVMWCNLCGRAARTFLHAP